jgi:hypothetical protein
MPAGRVPVRVIAGVGVPVVVTVNEPAVPTVNAAVAPLVNAGAWLTVNVAAAVVAVPAELVNTARYRLPLSPEAAVKVYVRLVAPVMLLKLPPTERCHRTVGVGLPDAAAVKLTEVPALTVWLDGLVVTIGAWAVMVAAVLPLFVVAGLALRAAAEAGGMSTVWQVSDKVSARPALTHS